MNVKKLLRFPTVVTEQGYCSCFNRSELTIENNLSYITSLI
jgi:hypothetical protein